MLCYTLSGFAVACNGVLSSTNSASTPSTPCSGSYTDTEFGINFAPPAGAVGPTLADEGDTLRVVTWQSAPTARDVIATALTYPIAPLDVELDAAVQAAMDAQRELLSAENGNTLLTDEPVTLDGGNEAHVLTGASEDGSVALVYVTATGAERFATVFEVGNAGAVETMLVSALSLCVE